MSSEADLSQITNILQLIELSSQNKGKYQSPILPYTREPYEHEPAQDKNGKKICYCKSTDCKYSTIVTTNF